jgi:hypothetical protein
MQNLQQDIRALRSDELDAVTGGIINGCIKLPSIFTMLPGQPKPFEDIFAKKVPAWVRGMPL